MYTWIFSNSNKPVMTSSRGHGMQLSIVNPHNLVYTAIIYFENNVVILKIIRYDWVYNIVGNLFLKI